MINPNTKTNSDNDDLDTGVQWGDVGHVDMPDGTQVDLPLFDDSADNN